MDIIPVSTWPEYCNIEATLPVCSVLVIICIVENQVIDHVTVEITYEWLRAPSQIKAISDLHKGH